MIIGITGGIASGKSLVTDYLKQKGYFVIDSDEIAHEAYNINTTEYHKILSLFSAELNGGELDRKKIASIVFNDKEKLKALESIIHPYVFKRIEELKKNNKDKLIFISMPLLFEVGYDKKVDKIITVSVSETTEILRLMNRDNIDFDYASKKIKSQMPLKEKVNNSDYIVDNNYSINETYITVDNILKDLEKMVK